MNRRFLLSLLSATAVLPTSEILSAESLTSPVYELRIYTTHEGKLEALLARFRDHTCRLFEKYGMTNVGYWIPLAKEDGAENTLIYLLKHDSEAAAKASFAAFSKDPEWQAARQASEAGGKLLSKPPQSIFLKTTDFSPPVHVEAADPERVFELRIYTTPAGKLDALLDRFRNHTMSLFSKHGMHHFGYWTPTPSSPDSDHQLIYILTHASHEAGLASFTAFRQDPAWIAAKSASEKEGSLTLPQPEGVKSIYMKATDFSPTK